MTEDALPQRRFIAMQQQALLRLAQKTAARSQLFCAKRQIFYSVKLRVGLTYLPRQCASMVQIPSRGCSEISIHAGKNGWISHHRATELLG